LCVLCMCVCLWLVYIRVSISDFEMRVLYQWVRGSAETT